MTVVRRVLLTISVVVLYSEIFVVKEPSSFFVSVTQIETVSFLRVEGASVVSLNTVMVVVQVFSSNVVEVVFGIFSVLVVVTRVKRKTVAVLVVLSISSSVMVLPGGTSLVWIVSTVSSLTTRLETSVSVVLTGRLTVVYSVAINVSRKRSVLVTLTVLTVFVMALLVKITTLVTVLVVDRETLSDITRTCCVVVVASDTRILSSACVVNVSIALLTTFVVLIVLG